MPPDGLARRLAELLAQGALPKSKFSRSALLTLGQLFRIDVLREERAGRGHRVVVADEPGLRAWISSQYPSGLAPDLGGLSPRAASIAHVAHSKRGGRLAAEPVFLRGFGETELTGQGGTLPLARLTREFEVASILLRKHCTWRMNGTLAVVENLEVFLHVENVVPTLDAALLSEGRLSNRAIEWLASMDDLRVLHMGDYDPVGLDEYLRLREAMASRVTLFVPNDLEELVRRYGRSDLIAASPALLDGVRRRADDAVASVLTILDRHGRALEQEALLL